MKKYEKYEIRVYRMPDRTQPNSALTKKAKDANRFGAEAAERRGERLKTAISLSPMKESMTMTMARGASSLEEEEEEENKE